jgi:predicted acetyltransferase
VGVTFRFAEPADLPEVGRLAAHSFPGPSRTPAWWLEQLRDPLYGGGAETLWTGDEGGRIVAACQLHPLRQWIAGNALDVMGLGTVAISPTHRRRGLAGELVAGGLRAARERGAVGSALYPFRISFYARLGYGLAGHALQYRIAPDCVPDAPERSRVELAESDAARAEVRAMYEVWAATQTGQLARPEGVWERMLGPGDRALAAFRGESGRVEGYALAVYRVDLPPQDRFLEVEEIAWLTPEARRGLFAWLGSLGDQWRQLLIRVLPSHHLGAWLSEPRLPWGSAAGWGLWFPSATLLAGPMFRVLDLERAWRQRAVAPEAALTLRLDVSDEAVPENAGVWRLRLAEGRVEVERGGGAADVALRLDVAALSRLFVSALTPSAALDAGLLSADRPERLAELDRALHLPEPWTFDRF